MGCTRGGHQVLLTLLVLVFCKRCVGCRAKPGTIRLDSFEFAHHKISALTLKLFFNGITRGFAETVYTQYVLRFGFGLDVRSGAEIDTSSWPAPDMVSVGQEAMVNGGAVLASPIIMYGKMTSQRTSLRRRCFLGNMSVVPSGARLGDDTLLGVMSVAPEEMPSGSTWLGSQHFL